MAAEKMTPLTSLPPAPQRFSDDPDVFSERAEETSEALVAMVNEINTGVIPQFNSTVEPMNQVLSNLTDIKTVSDITPAVVSVAGIKGNVLSVDSVKPQIVRVSQSATNLDRVHTSIGAVDTVSSHIANVDTVAVKIVDVASVAGHMANVDTVATHMDNVDTTVAHMASVDSVAGNMADVQAVAGISSAVSTVAAANETLTRLDAQTPMLTRVDAIRADVTTVAGIEAEVASVAGDRDVINTVHAALPKIEAVETNLPHIVAVDNAETAIRLAGLHINTIDAVGGNMPAVQAVAGNLGDIAKVTADMPHVKVVAEHTANVDAVGRNIAAVQEVDRRLQLVIDAPGNAAIAAEAAAEAARQAGLAKQHADSASAVAGLPVATDANDQQPVIWDKDLRKFGFGQPGGAALLPAPAVTAPALLPVGFAVAFTLTGLPGLVGTEIASFQWQVNDGEMQDFTATSNSYSGSFTAQGIDADVWTLKARAIDSKGNVSLWNQTTAVLVTPRVVTPTVTAPFAGAIVSNQTVALASSAFAATHLADTHKASRWILSTDAAGNNILHDSGWRQDALTAYTAVMSPVADADTPIFAHVQHEGAKIGQSDKSVAVQVHTSYVLRPAVTSPLLSTMVGTERIELTCAAFATFAGSFDTHVASRWWVTTDATGNNALCDSGWTSDYLTEYTAVLSPLADPASDLYLWVEHRGALLGDSAKSASVRVVTGSLQTPGVVSPAAGTIVLPTAFTVTGSSFAAVAGATDTMRALYVQVATDELFTSKVYDSGRVLTASESHALTFAAQTQGAALFVRLRYEGTTLGISGWSAPVRVVVTQVQTPAINSPVEGATGVPVKPLMTMTAYAATGNLDTGANTQVQIATDATFASITYDSGEMAYTTSHTVVTALTPAAGQCARFRHKGQILGWTPWSASVNFTTGMVQTPSIVSPAEGGFILPTTFTAVCSPFVALGATDTLKAVTLQVAKDIGFTNMVYNQRHVGASTSIAVTLPEQTQGSTLYLRAMYEGNALGASEWSAARRVIIHFINEMKCAANSMHCSFMDFVQDTQSENDVMWFGLGGGASSYATNYTICGTLRVDAAINTSAYPLFKIYHNTQLDALYQKDTVKLNNDLFASYGTGNIGSANNQYFGYITIFKYTKDQLTITKTYKLTIPGEYKQPKIIAILRIAAGKYVVSYTPSGSTYQPIYFCELSIDELSGTITSVSNTTCFTSGTHDITINTMSKLQDGRILICGSCRKKAEQFYTYGIVGILRRSGVGVFQIDSIRTFLIAQDGRKHSTVYRSAVMKNGNLFLMCLSGAAGMQNYTAGCVMASISGNNIELFNGVVFADTQISSSTYVNLSYMDDKIALCWDVTPIDNLFGQMMVIGSGDVANGQLSVNDLKIIGNRKRTTNVKACVHALDGRMLFAGIDINRGGMCCIITPKEYEALIPSVDEYVCEKYVPTRIDRFQSIAADTILDVSASTVSSFSMEDWPVFLSETTPNIEYNSYEF